MPNTTPFYILKHFNKAVKNHLSSVPQKFDAEQKKLVFPEGQIEQLRQIKQLVIDTVMESERAQDKEGRDAAFKALGDKVSSGEVSHEVGSRAKILAAVVNHAVWTERLNSTPAAQNIPQEQTQQAQSGASVGVPAPTTK